MKMKRFVTLLTAITLSASMLVLSSCGNSTKSSESAAPAGETASSQPSSQSTGDNVLRISYSGTPETHEKEYLIDTFFKKFEEENNVKVEVDFIAQADSIKKIQTEQETGNIISDILYVDTANMAPYVNGGWVQDISGIVQDTGITVTNMFDASTNNGDQRFFVPMSFDVYITIANKKALQYLPEGLTEEDVVKGITWEQYAKWAIAIAAGEGAGKAMLPANLDKSQLLYPLGGMSLAYGGDFPEVASEGFQKAMGIVAEMAQGNAFYSEQAQYTAPTDPLNSGEVWLTFAHMAPVGTAYNAAPNEYIIGAAPKGSNGAGSTSGAWCYGIQKGAKNQELAEKFIRYVTTPQVNYDFCSNYGGALSPIQEVGDILESSDVVMRAGIEMLQTTTIRGVPATKYTDWNAVKLIYGEIFNKVLADKAVPSPEYFTEMQAKLDALKIQ